MRRGETVTKKLIIVFVSLATGVMFSTLAWFVLRSFVDSPFPKYQGINIASVIILIGVTLTVYAIWSKCQKKQV